MPEYNFNWNATKSCIPKATISKITISLNERCVDMIGRPKNAEIGYDSEKRAIAIRASKGGGNSYKFAERLKNGWVRLGCRTLLRDIGEQKTRNVKVLIEDGMIILKL